MSKLEEIVAYKRQEVTLLKRERPLSQVEKILKARPPVRDFQEAITRTGKLSLIAEIKRSSPSAGNIRSGVNAVELAQAYAAAGAQAVSVLTDRKFFSGSLSDLTSVKEKVSLPVLRKDFLLEEYQLIEAAAAGADAVLLIVAILEPPLLRRLLGLADDLGMDALVEVHTERELGQALEAGAAIVGINNRDLDTFRVDIKTTQRLAPRIPQGIVRVSESGIHSRADVEFLQAQGADALLIGEELVSSPDPAKRIRELMSW